MTTAEIKDYLEMLVNLERERFLQAHFIDTIRNRISILGHPRPIYEPVMEKPKGEETDWGNLAVVVGSGGIIGGIMGLVTGHGLFNAIGNALIGALFVGIISGVLYVIYRMIIHSSTLKEDKAAKEKDYHRRYNAYKDALKKDEERVSREKNALVYLNQELNILTDCYEHTCTLLNQLYGLNILYKKYHNNFAAVSSIYDYFCSGMVTSFEGPDGAYSRLEYEIRLDRISIQLDIVIRNLEDIKQNQFMLYTAISEANEKLNTLIESSNKIESKVQQIQAQGKELSEQIAGLQTTSDLTLYVNALNNQELSYMRRWIAR